MIKENKSAVGVSVGVPSVVVGVLVALKHIGMTNLSYWDIIWFGLEVWLVCVCAMLVILGISIFIGMIIGTFK